MAKKGQGTKKDKTKWSPKLVAEVALVTIAIAAVVAWLAALVYAAVVGVTPGG